MNTKIEITEAMVDRAMFVLRDSPPFSKRSLVANAIRAALNPPPLALCKHCGKGEPLHICVTAWGKKFNTCPGYFFEPAS